MEKFILKSLQYFSLLTCTALLAACSGGAVDPEENEIDSYNIQSGVFSNQIDAGRPAIYGTGTLRFSKSIFSGVYGKVSYTLRGRLDQYNSHITLISHSNSTIMPNSGIGIQIVRDMLGIKILTWAGAGNTVTYSNPSFSAILYNDFDIVIDIHNNNDNTYRILVWPRNYLVYSAATSIIAPQVSLNQGSGAGNYYGLIVDLATISGFSIGPAKVPF